VDGVVEVGLGGEVNGHYFFFVMRGLDPRIHLISKKRSGKEPWRDGWPGQARP
jgi:hypothetical protein